MALLQHQRIPLGTLKLGDRELPVFITVAWLKALQGLDAASAAPAPAPAPSPAPDDSIDLDTIEWSYDGVAAVRAMTIGLQRAVEGLEVDTTPALLARLAALERRVADLELGP